MPEQAQAEFPIIGWAQFPPALTRPDVLEHVKRCGIDVLMTTRGKPDVIRQQIDTAAECGLRMLVVDPRFAPTDEEGWRDRAIAAAKEYADHAGVFGLFVIDEPLHGQFEATAEMVALLKDHSTGQVIYVNGLGWGSRGADTLMQYVEDYARVIRPDYLSFDAYPIPMIPPDAESDAFYQRDVGVTFPELGAYYRDRYWEAWETYRLVSWKYDLPLWGFALATPHQHSVWFYGPVTEGTLRLEAFTGLAHGIEALQYFTLPTELTDGWDDGIISPDGTPSARYEAVRRVNRDVRQLGPIVSRLTCERVFHTGPLTSYCCRWTNGRHPRDTQHRCVGWIDGDPAIISFLKKGSDEHHMMVVNRNPGRRARVRVEMRSEWSAVEISKHDARTQTPRGQAMNVDLEPGDGRLFRFTPVSDEQ